MRIQPLADLHVEMSPCDIPVVGDVIVLAGDIHVGVESVRLAKGQFDGKPGDKGSDLDSAHFDEWGPFRFTAYKLTRVARRMNWIGD